MEQPNKEPRTISIKIDIDKLTDSMIVDKEKGVNILLVAVPLSTPKLTALGFLLSVLDNMQTFYKHAEAQYEARKKGGIVTAGINEIAALGRKLVS